MRHDPARLKRHLEARLEEVSRAERWMAAFVKIWLAASAAVLVLFTLSVLLPAHPHGLVWLAPLSGLALALCALWPELKRRRLRERIEWLRCCREHPDDPAAFASLLESAEESR